MSSGRLVLVTGYVGGRLLPALLAHGEHVRCLARRPEAIALPVVRLTGRYSGWNSARVLPSGSLNHADFPMPAVVAM